MEFARWDWVAQISLAQLRMEAARDPKDPRLAELVGEPSLQDPDFRRWWGAHRVAVQGTGTGTGTGTKVLHHPIAGRLTLDWSFLTCTAEPDQQLITLTAEPGTPSHDRLRILASWAAQAAGHPVAQAAGPSVADR